MTELLMSDRECHCELCTGIRTERHEHVHADGEQCRADNTSELVARFGWSSLGIATGNGVPAWAYSIGLWHSFGSPEIAMFGLQNPDMQRWVNALGDQIKAGRPMRVDEMREGIIDGFPVRLRPVHESWYPHMFGTALRFYNHRPPLPIMQMIWPDRRGLFPWDDEVGAACKANQPWLWLPMDEHPPGLWPELESISPWPFPAHDVFEQAFTSTALFRPEGVLRGIVHNQDGQWEFHDGSDVTSESIELTHLHHVLARFPQIRPYAELPAGRMVWLQTDGSWAEFVATD